MNLKRVLKGVILGASVMMVTACNSQKINNEEELSTMNVDVGMDTNDNILSSDEQARLYMQELQQSNIVYFDLDKYNIRSNFIQMLDMHADFLRRNSFYKLTIEGHADERGTPEYNIALGERRANAVKMYLQGKGILANQISIVSYGKEKPVVLGHDEVAYAKNRRAILIY